MPMAELATRRLTPERLDGLAPDDPSALRSRIDLGRINAIMMQAGTMAGLLRRALGKPRPVRILDIGAGDGRFMVAVARRLGPPWRGSSVVLLDRQRGLLGERQRRDFERLGWTARPVCAEAAEFLGRAAADRFDAVTANLVLHHFDGAALSSMLASAADRADVFAACEPRRSVFARTGARLLWAIGANEVTRHDARVSVEAGFRGGELTALWPAPAGWTVRETYAWPFTHAFLAVRGGPP